MHIQLTFLPPFHHLFFFLSLSAITSLLRHDGVRTSEVEYDSWIVGCHSDWCLSRRALNPERTLAPWLTECATNNKFCGTSRLLVGLYECGRQGRMKSNFLWKSFWNFCFFCATGQCPETIFLVCFFTHFCQEKPQKNRQAESTLDNLMCFIPTK